MDLDALREALERNHWFPAPDRAQSNEVWWCERHRAGRRLMLGSPPPEICPIADVAARRLGQNPFDRITCSMVRVRLLAEEGT